MSPTDFATFCAIDVSIISGITDSTSAFTPPVMPAADAQYSALGIPAKFMVHDQSGVHAQRSHPASGDSSAQESRQNGARCISPTCSTIMCHEEYRQATFAPKIKLRARQRGRHAGRL